MDKTKKRVTRKSSSKGRSRSIEEEEEREEEEKEEEEREEGEKEEGEGEKEDEEDIIYGNIVPLKIGHTQVSPSENYHIVASVIFHDGYSLRQQYEFLKSASGRAAAPLQFKRNGILLETGNVDGTLVSKTFFNSEDLIEYSVNEEYWNNPDKQCHIININLKNFYEKIRKITKKESVCLCQYHERPDIVFMKRYGGKNPDAYTTLKTERYDEIRYNIEDGTEVDKKPNVKVTLSAFTAACLGAANSDRQTSKFKCGPEGVRILSSNNLGTSTTTDYWGSFRAKSTYYYTTVDTSIFKSLAKITNYNNNGIVKIYSKGDGIVRIETNLGSMAQTTIHVVDKKLLSGEEA
jgi:hypothetical protein